MCQTCNNANTCLTCKASPTTGIAVTLKADRTCAPVCTDPKTFPNVPTLTCLPCLADCDACTNAATCTRCKAGTFWDGTACAACPAGCATCQNSNFCFTCSGGVVPQRGLCPSTGHCGSGKFLNYSNNQCTNCIAGCDQCTNASTCVKCASGKSPNLEKTQCA